MRYLLLFVLTTSFLAVQWTTTHIHLAEQHTHEGSFHQHQADAHTHHLAGQHVDAIDFSHTESHGDTIVFDYKYSFTKREKQKSATAILAAPVFLSSLSASSARIQSPDTITKSSGYLDHSKLNIRAPPKTS